VLEPARLLLFFGSLAGAGASIAMHLGRLVIHPWLRVAAYALPVIAVLLIVVAGLRAPRFVTPPKMPLLFKVIVAGAFAFATIHVAIHLRHGGAFTLDAASESIDGRRAVTSALFAGYTLAVAILWRRVPKRPKRL
jgi:hypothetical protein